MLLEVVGTWRADWASHISLFHLRLASFVALDHELLAGGLAPSSITTLLLAA